MTRILPQTQKWLTNVITIQIDIKDNHFELACYQNKINAYKNGTETDLSNVLQTEDVFTNVAQGELATNATLQASFQTLNKTTICNKIITEGRLSLSNQERKHESSRIRKEVISQAQQRCTHIQTGKQIPFQMLENAIHEIGFQINSFPASEQAASLVNAIQSEFGVLKINKIKIVIMWKGEEGMKRLNEIGIQEEQQDKIQDGDWNVQISDVDVEDVKKLKEIKKENQEIINYYVEKSFGMRVK
ncbi:Shwachman-Bodian-Diamond syndrome protein-like protein [Spironucleus salmonicida]|uniref:Shwachman-Bodian-Diamond syndrome protein-like protein n=1 Tax=Spironucleus salmonicida TaxID=348837 RepID=V6LFR7_9EUKA|nr:Shwachman-Bodian-Diamond syndrome protein-like protein [Spironucleus salmonicida]|eukprot:EST43342.1 Shwachman-Bodian-Diamond syndrome protein-like protein [Spironucleus salmonicida]